MSALTYAVCAANGKVATSSRRTLYKEKGPHPIPELRPFTPCHALGNRTIGMPGAEKDSVSRSNARYLPAYEDFLHHKKLFALARALQAHRAVAVLILQELWRWAMANAHDGVIHITPQELTREIHVDDLIKGEDLMRILMQTRWLDVDDTTGKPKLHEWDLYGGRSIVERQKEIDATKARRARAKERRAAEASRKKNERHAKVIQIRHKKEPST